MRKKQLIESVRSLINDNQIIKALETLQEHLPGDHSIQDALLVMKGDYQDLVATAAGRSQEKQREAVNGIKFSISKLYEILPDPKVERKILFLSANPAKTDRLRLDHEAREIDETLAATTYREDFVWVPKQAVTVKTITGALQQVQPEIVHFSGHGAGAEGIVVE
ncbi:MAG: hypothetical protein R3330_04435, partial [Saprospiraceae bacterium]|nr:hypothetical protein [Saprospiraceae bacterium]